MRTVEMIGDGAVIGFHAGSPKCGKATGCDEAGEGSQDAAAGQWHGR